VTRGDIYWADVPGGRRPVVIVTRTAALPYLTQIVVAPLTSTLRDIPSHVRLDERQGLQRESAVNCDALVTVRVATLTDRIGTLDPAAQLRLDNALRFALGLDG
jgi:mRNA interferase MazF